MLIYVLKLQVALKKKIKHHVAFNIITVSEMGLRNFNLSQTPVVFEMRLFAEPIVTRNFLCWPLVWAKLNSSYSGMQQVLGNMCTGVQLGFLVQCPGNSLGFT